MMIVLSSLSICLSSIMFICDDVRVESHVGRHGYPIPYVGSMCPARKLMERTAFGNLVSLWIILSIHEARV